MGNDVLDEIPAELREEPISTPSRVYANDGETVIATFYAGNREPVAIEDISQPMQDAIIAIEDERFYEHSGTDVRAILRAAVNNLTTDSTEGGSTLTHQYVSLILLNADLLQGSEELVMGGTTTLADRLNEARLAVSLEEEMTKEEILEGYLNLVLLGGRTYGVEAAAQYYWGISASELNIQQSATLAGMVQSPNGYNPEFSPEASQERRDVVLAAMLRNEFIDDREYDQAIASELDLDIQPERDGCIAADSGQYFCDYVQRLILSDETFGETPEEREHLLDRGGLSIRTTLDPTAQLEAEDQVLEAVPVEETSGNRATILSVAPDTGDILTMAQSTVYDPDAEAPGHTTVNYNLDYADGESGGFAVGSTLKPFIAAAWIEEGGSMDDVVDASVTEYEYGENWTASCMPGGSVPLLPDGEDDASDAWEPANVGDFERPMTIDYGLYNSVNTATVATAYEMDLCAINDTIDRLGITYAQERPAPGEEGETSGDIDFAGTPAAVLGAAEISPLTLATAYATFANDGVRCEPRAILEVTDAQGNQYSVPETDCEQVIDPDVVAQVNDTMINIAERNAASDNPPFPMAGKTGTSGGSTNTWFLGSTEGVTTAAHVGRTDDNRAQINATINNIQYSDGFYGSSLAMPMWHDYMTAIAGSYSTGDFREAENSPWDNRRADRYGADDATGNDDSPDNNDDNESDGSDD